MLPSRKRYTKKGFSLAELLISLGLLGLVAVFTIPKLIGFNPQKERAIVKDTALMVAAAYEAYRMQQTPTASTGWDELLPYLNYLKADSSTIIDDIPNSPWGPTVNCGDVDKDCYVLHNGAVIYTDVGMEFGGTGYNNAILFIVDPDGTSNSVQSVGIILYYDGKVKTYGTGRNPTNHAVNGIPSFMTPAANMDPDWFSWN